MKKATRYGLPIGAACGMPASSPIATVRTGGQFLIFPSTTSQSRFCKPDPAIPGKLNRAIDWRPGAFCTCTHSTAERAGDDMGACCCSGLLDLGSQLIAGSH